jgi:lipopolysaccharide/colanic/teichoic acid biosynthesis glycosyltransferase
MAQVRTTLGRSTSVATNSTSAAESRLRTSAVRPRRRLTVAPVPSEPRAEYEMPRTFYVRVLKPGIDRVCGVVLCVLLAPLFAVVAVAVRLSLGAPVIFRQRRVGLGGAEFDVYKFRTMKHDRRRLHQPVGVDRRRTHKSDEDPRHTRVGRFLRKWSLDELPQLWNVVRGEMSLVGPRPELVEVVDRYEPWQHRRHAVKPGLFGLWQVSKRGTGLMHLHTDVDLEYVDTVGPIADLKILLRTIPAMLTRRGH